MARLPLEQARGLFGCGPNRWTLYADLPRQLGECVEVREGLLKHPHGLDSEGETLGSLRLPAARAGAHTSPQKSGLGDNSEGQPSVGCQRPDPGRADFGIGDQDGAFGHRPQEAPPLFRPALNATSIRNPVHDNAALVLPSVKGARRDARYLSLSACRCEAPGGSNVHLLAIPRLARRQLQRR